MWFDFKHGERMNDLCHTRGVAKKFDDPKFLFDNNLDIKGIHNNIMKTKTVIGRRVLGGTRQKGIFGLQQGKGRCHGSLRGNMN